MRTIYKYPIKLGTTLLRIPGLRRFIHVGVQDNQICLWAEVDTSLPKEAYEIHVLGTGWSLPEEPIRHIGSVEQSIYVWHVYEKLGAVK